MALGIPSFFDIDERLRELSAKGDDLELSYSPLAGQFRG